MGFNNVTFMALISLFNFLNAINGIYQIKENGLSHFMTRRSRRHCKTYRHGPAYRYRKVGGYLQYQLIVTRASLRRCLTVSESSLALNAMPTARKRRLVLK